LTKIDGHFKYFLKNIKKCIDKIAFADDNYNRFVGNKIVANAIVGEVN